MKKRFDVARAGREQHLPRQRADEGRQHEGDEEQELHRLLERQVGPRDEPGEESADDRPGDGHAAGEEQRVEKCLVGLLAPQDFDDVRHVEVARRPRRH